MVIAGAHPCERVLVYSRKVRGVRVECFQQGLFAAGGATGNRERRSVVTEDQAKNFAQWR